jgi:hypothetical protein
LPAGNSPLDFVALKSTWIVFVPLETITGVLPGMSAPPFILKIEANVMLSDAPPGADRKPTGAGAEIE